LDGFVATSLQARAAIGLGVGLLLIVGSINNAYGVTGESNQVIYVPFASTKQIGVYGLDLKKIKDISLPFQPGHLVISPNGRKLFVVQYGLGGSEVAVIDLSKGTLERTVALGETCRFLGAGIGGADLRTIYPRCNTSLAVSQDGSKVFIPAAGKILTLSTSTFETASFDIPMTGSINPAILHYTNLVYQQEANTLFFYDAQQSTIRALNLSDRSVSDIVSLAGTGAWPEGPFLVSTSGEFVVDQSGRNLYVIRGLGRRGQPADSGWEILKVDIFERVVTRQFVVPGQPQGLALSLNDTLLSFGSTQLGPFYSFLTLDVNTGKFSAPISVTNRVLSMRPAATGDLVVVTSIGHLGVFDAVQAKFINQVEAPINGLGLALGKPTRGEISSKTSKAQRRSSAKK
jgi:hypothetical protein